MALVDNGDDTFSIKRPNPFRELTDEEIVAVYKEVFGWDVQTSDKNWVGLARAMMKKLEEVQRNG